ncbi:MAG: redoxin domain-containing protein [Chthonomonadales bacterium]
MALALSDWKAEIGKPVPDFSLPAVGGRTVQLYAEPKKAYVVVFVSKNCPVSRAYVGRLKNLAADPAYADVAFLAVNSNSDEPMAEVEADARQNRYPFPVAKDEGNVIADHFQAKATPTVWVMNSDRVAVYRGAIDDNQDEARVTRRYLKDALDALLAGRSVPTPSTLAFGCAVHRVHRPTR